MKIGVNMRLKSDTKIYIEKNALPGVKRVAGKLSDDFLAVFGDGAAITEFESGRLPEDAKEGTPIIAATLGHSDYLTSLIRSGDFDASAIEGKWEVYYFGILPAKDGFPERLLIAGSDKRGTIYGLFHVSEILGVSPWYWFADVVPEKKDHVEITGEDTFVSKVPSVRYRGFFINDEWPAFGNWTFEHFGGFTAEMYDHVFELLLRLKGNYLWPAMWTSNFSLDGPGLENARLADEYGIVMSNSHHEPCLRHSEEWDIVKGEDTPYGTAWNFDRNREGLSNYWRGGLERNGKFENIITMGMRGERDSEVLGATATLKDNIDYIKDVVTTQNRLIKETVNEDLSKVPRMIAIYKEVEKYFHGDENTEGFKNWDGLDGITCMLCEDNFGNLRTLPEKDNMNRKGGWGMYYHFDYHGDPISYEWINSTHIARTCEQMSQAYDYGIREIWIVNVGDLKPQEFPLSYFLDLAYDIEKWGQDNPNAVKEYTDLWTKKQFPGLDSEKQNITSKLLEGYTRINYIRKPEALGSETYNPSAYGESDAMLRRAERLTKTASDVFADIKGTPISDAYYQLVYFPVMAAMNLLKMQLCAGKNHMLAKMGAQAANRYADLTEKCMDEDRWLCDEYHALNGGKWNGMMRSEHVGFTHWNDEECAYPIVCRVRAANKPRMIVTAGNDPEYTMGGDWTRKKLTVLDFMDAGKTESLIYIRNGSDKPFDYQVEGLGEWLFAEKSSGTVNEEETVTLSIDRSELKKIAGDDFKISKKTITIRTSFAHVDIDVYATANGDTGYVPLISSEYTAGAGRPARALSVNELGLVLEAKDAVKLSSGSEGEYRLIEGLGKYDGALKAFPTTAYFTPGKDAPCAEFTFSVSEDAALDLTIITAPNNPVVKGNPMNVGISLNDGDIETLATVEAGYEGGERSCRQWAGGVLDQAHYVYTSVKAKKGENVLRIFAMDPGVVIERILIRQSSTKWSEGYIGKLPAWIRE